MELLFFDFLIEFKAYTSQHSIRLISLFTLRYRWSSWQRIVNRQANTFTWRPTDEEEVTLFEAFKDDAEHAKEFKTIVHLDHKCAGGDSINVVMSVEMGHSPIIRIYAQYW